MWCISDGNGLFWSNEDGWVSYCTCDMFDNDEKKSMNLPIGGEWRKSLGGPKIYQQHKIHILCQIRPLLSDLTGLPNWTNTVQLGRLLNYP